MAEPTNETNRTHDAPRPAGMPALEPNVEVITEEERKAQENELREMGAKRQAAKVQNAQERDAGNVDIATLAKAETPEEAWARDPIQSAARTPAGGQLPGMNLPPASPPSLSASTQAEMKAGKEALDKHKAGMEAAKEKTREEPVDYEILSSVPANSLPDLPRLPDHDAEDAFYALKAAEPVSVSDVAAKRTSKKK